MRGQVTARLGPTRSHQQSECMVLELFGLIGPHAHHDRCRYGNVKLGGSMGADLVSLFLTFFHSNSLFQFRLRFGMLG